MKQKLLSMLVPAMTAAIIAAMIIPGCATLNDPPEPVQYYTLSYPAPDAPANGTAHPGVVLAVKAFDAGDPYRSRQMVYADNQYRRQTYVYHQWISKPADMLRDRLVRDLRAAQVAGAVLCAEKSLQPPTHTLEVFIEAFHEDDAGNPWQAVLTLTATLAGNPDLDSNPSVLLQKTYEVRKDLDQNNPLGLAEAMSKALARSSNRIIADIHDALEP
jgi:uncharacterized lipoprotein YmbA